MAAGGLSNSVFIENTMNKIDYLTIKKNNLLTGVEKLALQGSWICPKHTTKVVQECTVPHS